MAKISITLPNAANITFEAEEPEIIREVIGMVLRDLPRDLMQAQTVSTNENSKPQRMEKGSSVVSGPPIDTLGTEDIQTPALPDVPSVSAAANLSSSGTSNRPRRTPATSIKRPAADPPEAVEPATIERSGEADLAFFEFCRSANPLGDMRRVVVAAEGANRFLGMNSVDGKDLVGLFSLAGWRLPHSFTQTLRNAARDKFRWLERVPGRSGRYSVSDLGRDVTKGLQSGS